MKSLPLILESQNGLLYIHPKGSSNFLIYQASDLDSLLTSGSRPLTFNLSGPVPHFSAHSNYLLFSNPNSSHLLLIESLLSKSGSTPLFGPTADSTSNSGGWLSSWLDFNTMRYLMFFLAFAVVGGYKYY
jgi:hypothetical protein